MSTLRTLAVLLSALAPAACATTQSAPAPPAPLVRVAAGSPQAVLTRVKSEAVARGWRVVDEGVDTLLVDFGTADVRIAVPNAGRAGTGTAQRATEVHGSALYVFRPAAAGTEIAVVDNPIYWHPDLACWMPGPPGLLPSAALLPSDAHVGTQ